jgi:hypothetical protein
VGSEPRSLCSGRLLDVGSVCRDERAGPEKHAGTRSGLFQGNLAKDRWRVETPEFSADASACVGTVIGGRLDWKLFAQACERLLPLLLSEPIPFPPP